MYYYLHGMITFHTPNSIVIECSGVGYDVNVSHPDEFPIGETLFVFVSYISNENEQYFVGFKTLEEKNLYNALTSVKGIGPKTALAAMGETSVYRLSEAINKADDVFLMRLPGIGKKSASQIILDLKGKLTMMESESNVTLSKNMDLALQGLKNYGFKDKEIKDALLSINEKDLTVEDYLKKALVILSKN